MVTSSEAETALEDPAAARTARHLSARFCQRTCARDALLASTSAPCGFTAVTGVFPSPPNYAPARAKLVKETSSAFTAIDIYSGERLGVGDILVYRPIHEPIGHVFIVKNINPVNMVTEVVEAAQSAGTIREREFPLSITPPNAPRRVLRPGIMALRLCLTDNPACSYRDHRKQASSDDTPAHREGTPNGTAGGAL